MIAVMATLGLDIFLFTCEAAHPAIVAPARVETPWRTDETFGICRKIVTSVVALPSTSAYKRQWMY
jgi:hypothetical protein